MMEIYYRNKGAIESPMSELAPVVGVPAGVAHALITAIALALLRCDVLFAMSRDSTVNSDVRTANVPSSSSSIKSTRSASTYSAAEAQTRKPIWPIETTDTVGRSQQHIFHRDNARLVSDEPTAPRVTICRFQTQFP